MIDSLQNTALCACLCCCLLITFGCGSAEYNNKVEATAAELRRNQPEEPVAAEEPAEAAAPVQPEPDPFAEEAQGAGGTPVGNAIGLAPLE